MDFLRRASKGIPLRTHDQGINKKERDQEGHDYLSSRMETTCLSWAYNKNLRREKA